MFRHRAARRRIAQLQARVAELEDAAGRSVLVDREYVCVDHCKKVIVNCSTEVVVLGSNLEALSRCVVEHSDANLFTNGAYRSGGR